MINRRKFIKTLSAFGISLPVMGSGAVTPKPAARKNNPVILCSRGESWGKKVLTPGWEILSKKGSLLFAVHRINYTQAQCAIEELCSLVVSAAFQNTQ